MKKYFLAIPLLFYVLVSFAKTEETQIQIINKVTQQWAQALSARDPEKIADLYDEEAILYATFDNKIEDRKDIIAYFKNLMKNPGLNVTFQEQHIRVFWETAVNSGFYTFNYQANGKNVSVPARYTFVYILGPKGWLILDHHSSVFPNEIKKS